MDLQRTALVTGAGRGLGRAIATRLAADGVLVAVHYARDRSSAERTVAEIEQAGGAAFAVAQILGHAASDGDELLRAVGDELDARTGARELDVVVHNAAIAPTGGLADVTPEQYEATFALNVRAPLFLMRSAAPRIRTGGRVVFISSGVTREVATELTVYSMSKAALDALARITAKTLAPRQITVNVVAPGVLDTDMNAGWLRGDQEELDRAAARAALGRLGEPADVAEVVAFLASDAARFVTGEWIDASGGGLL